MSISPLTLEFTNTIGRLFDKKFNDILAAEFQNEITFGEILNHMKMKAFHLNIGPPAKKAEDDDDDDNWRRKKKKTSSKRKSPPKKRASPPAKRKKKVATTTVTEETPEIEFLDAEPAPQTEPAPEPTEEPVPVVEKEEEEEIIVPAPPPKPLIRTKEYQSDKVVKKVFYVKKLNLTEDNIQIQFTNDMVEWSIQWVDGESGEPKEFTGSHTFLGPVSADACSYKLSKYKLELTMPKQTPGTWDEALFKVEEETDARKNVSTWGTQRNWQQVETHLDEEIEEMKPEGEGALMGLFQQIYKDADDETRRAMIKSYQTSGGTVLSTNWGEVKEKDYEGKDRVVPSGFKYQNEDGTFTDGDASKYDKK